nr:MAG: ORF1 [Torque teno midi virus]
MPFWWGRRNRWWRGRYRAYRRRRPYKTRRRRRRVYKRRRPRRTYKTRRRRRNKVRRKRKTIPVRQWQPDSITNCKIKGLGLLCLGAEGTQMYCFTDQKYNYVPPKLPSGGGFGVECYTLKYLYEEYTFHNNYWTKSNVLKDLCRFLRCKLTFFRHPDTDFIISYSRQPPFEFNKYTYPATHPHQQLLSKHKKVILSLASKPNGKYTKKIIIKPPKQMLTKWFFTKPFCKQGLFLLRGAASNFRYSFLTATNQNLLVSLLSLNPGFYKQLNWDIAYAQGHAYVPYPNINTQLQYVVKVKGQADQTKKIASDITTNNAIAISYDNGWFKSEFLQAKEIKASGTIHATTPMIAGRYNPFKDTGENNKIYITSTLTETWDPPTKDKMLLIEGMPLWLGLYGYYNFVIKSKTKEFLTQNVIILESPAIYCYPEVGSCKRYLPIDYEYTIGKKPWDQYISTADKAHWTPNMTWQTKTINAIVESGPFMPKYSEERKSTWELKYDYTFFFKWGGPFGPDTEVRDPTELPTYDVPDTINKRIQITNPEKQATETLIHPWDIRRGIIKEQALKRMCQHLETDTEFELPTEEPEKKKKRLGAALQDPYQETKEMQTCLLSLCEESTCQDQENQTLQDLIKQQQHQQQLLRYNILKLITDLKEKQKMLQLQTGMLE